jgi:hypothetical protein
MIKSSERKHINPSASRPCFEKSDRGPELGISFEKKDGAMRFALYSFLSAVDFDGTGELVFRYTFGPITVKGKALQPLWEHLRTCTLVRVCESESLLPSEAPSISEITLADLDAISTVEPLFPG